VRATQIRIAVSAVTDVVKMNTAMFIPNAVGIFTASNKVRSRPPGGAGNGTRRSDEATTTTTV